MTIQLTLAPAQRVELQLVAATVVTRALALPVPVVLGLAAATVVARSLEPAARVTRTLVNAA